MNIQRVVLHYLHTVHLTMIKVNMIFTEVEANHLVYIVLRWYGSRIYVDVSKSWYGSRIYVDCQQKLFPAIALVGKFY